jgi:ubiquinone/menaquinone biosynthesis C-methylase UbiE
MRPRFDAQADAFDSRAGLPEEVARGVAAAVVERARLRPGELCVEIGAGTGEIGKELAALELDYVAFDISAEMLERFRARLGEGAKARLIETDAAEPWPLEGRQLRAVFGSRSLHLVPAAHVVGQLLRFASPLGATLLAGRILRRREDPRSRLRKRMRELVSASGQTPLSGEHKTLSLFEECWARGAEPIALEVVARFTRSFTPARAIELWQSRPELAGVPLAAEQRELLGRELRVWAAAEFDDIEASLESVEEYAIEGARFDLK